MENNYKYYVKVIKPLEKKYTVLCTLYSIFKFKCLEKQKDLCNKLLINYYHSLDLQSLNTLTKYFDK